jgi:hypothetical protein
MANTPAAPRAPQRPRQGARHGDTTGKTREALQREHADELKERQGEITTIANEHERSINEDIVDYSDPERPVIEKPDGSQELADPVQKREEEREDETDLGFGVSVIEEPEPEAARRFHEALKTDPEYLNEKVLVRVNADLPDMTFGHNVTLSFEEGRRYRLPRYMAIHLEEKGLIWH